MLENFSKKLKKLDNYFIMQQEDEYFIVAIKKIFKEHIQIHSTFSTYTNVKDNELWTFFILTTNEKSPELEEYRKRSIPIIMLPNSILNLKYEMLRNYLDKEMSILL